MPWKFKLLWGNILSEVIDLNVKGDVTGKNIKRCSVAGLGCGVFLLTVSVWRGLRDCSRLVATLFLQPLSCKALVSTTRWRAFPAQIEYDADMQWTSEEEPFQLVTKENTLVSAVVTCWG